MALPAIAAGLAKGMAKNAIVKKATGGGKKGAAAKSFQKKPSERKEEGRGGAIQKIASGATPSSAAIVPFSPSITGNTEKKIASISSADGDPKLYAS